MACLRARFSLVRVTWGVGPIWWSYFIDSHAHLILKRKTIRDWDYWTQDRLGLWLGLDFVLQEAVESRQCCKRSSWVCSWESWACGLHWVLCSSSHTAVRLYHFTPIINYTTHTGTTFSHSFPCLTSLNNLVVLPRLLHIFLSRAFYPEWVRTHATISRRSSRMAHNSSLTRFLLYISWNISLFSTTFPYYHYWSRALWNKSSKRTIMLY